MPQNTHSRQILRYRLDYNLIYKIIFNYIIKMNIQCKENIIFIFFVLRIYIQKYIKYKKKIMKAVQSTAIFPQYHTEQYVDKGRK